MNKSAASTSHELLHFPRLADTPSPCSRPLSMQEYAEFSQSLLAGLTPQQIQRQQDLRRTITQPFRLLDRRIDR